jgi:hypothetical protein
MHHVHTVRPSDNGAVLSRVHFSHPIKRSEQVTNRRIAHPDAHIAAENTRKSH